MEIVVPYRHLLTQTHMLTITDAYEENHTQNVSVKRDHTHFYSVSVLHQRRTSPIEQIWTYTHTQTDPHGRAVCAYIDRQMCTLTSQECSSNICAYSS